MLPNYLLISLLRFFQSIGQLLSSYCFFIQYVLATTPSKINRNFVTFDTCIVVIPVMPVLPIITVLPVILWNGVVVSLYLLFKYYVALVLWYFAKVLLTWWCLCCSTCVVVFALFYIHCGVCVVLLMSGDVCVVLLTWWCLRCFT